MSNLCKMYHGWAAWLWYDAWLETCVFSPRVCPAMFWMSNTVRNMADNQTFQIGYSYFLSRLFLVFRFWYITTQSIVNLACRPFTRAIWTHNHHSRRSCFCCHPLKYMAHAESVPHMSIRTADATYGCDDARKAKCGLVSFCLYYACVLLTVFFLLFEIPHPRPLPLLTPLYGGVPLLIE